MSENKDNFTSEVGWDDSTLSLSDLQWFKGEKNKKKRIYIMTQKPFLARVHYHQGYFLCHSKYEIKDGVQQRIEKGKCCELLSTDPILRFGVIVLLYDTKPDGSLKSKDPKSLDFEFQIWLFGPDKFQTLKSQHAEWNLLEHDLQVTCSEEQYQKLEISPLRTTLSVEPALKARIDAAWELYRHKDPSRFLGKKLSPGEIVVRLGGELDKEATGTVGKVNDKEFDDVLRELDEGTTGSELKE